MLKLCESENCHEKNVNISENGFQKSKIIGSKVRGIFIAVQTGRKFECNDKHIDIQNQLAESQSKPVHNIAVCSKNIFRAVWNREKSHNSKFADGAAAPSQIPAGSGDRPHAAWS